MASESSPSNESRVSELLRDFGETRFGSVKAFAEALGMKPPALQGYLNGSRKPGVAVLQKLQRLGFDPSHVLGSPNGEFPAGHEGASTSAPSGNAPARATPYIDFEAAEFVLGRSLEAAAVHFDATPSEVRAWREGATPPLDKLVRLTNLILFEATGGRFQLRELEPSSPRPANEESRQQLTGT